jgi:hypothetical protein
MAMVTSADGRRMAVGGEAWAVLVGEVVSCASVERRAHSRVEG